MFETDIPRELVDKLYYSDTSPTELRWMHTCGGERRDSPAGSKRKYYTRRCIGWRGRQFDLDTVLKLVKQRDRR